MKISVITLFPNLYEQFIASSIIGRSVTNGVVSFDIKDMRSFCAPKERIDGPTFGHHAGMIIRPEVVQRSFDFQEKAHGRALRIFFSPRGARITQDRLRIIAEQAQPLGHVAFFAARYEGVDARAEEAYADHVLSLGDFVLMGGDIPAQIVIEGLLRYVPGVVGNQESVERDSFSGPYVDCPAYTAPAVWQDREVPEVLRSGDHKKIEQWSAEQSIRDTALHHFEWLRSHVLAEGDQGKVLKAIPSHYVALMHDEINLPHGIIGTTSVTSLDIHDIARSAKTYGLKKFFIVTPLQDQQKIVKTLLSFWQVGDGINYNKDRTEALQSVVLLARFQEVYDAITAEEGVEPVVVVTSARDIAQARTISYRDQEEVWKLGRPVLLLLGTGCGLAESMVQRAHFVLVPVKGLSGFNHLSVRSAAAIIFDRWLGLQPEKLC